MHQPSDLQSKKKIK